MKQLYDKDQVFGFIGNVGTPTAAVGIPYALQNKALFFGAFTGAGILRHDPPDRYVFNYRAGYAEETDAVVRYLIKLRHLQPRQIAVFAQQDAYGDAGFAGVTRAIRALGGSDATILRLDYKRNTVDVDDAIARANATMYGFGGSIWSKNIARGSDLARRLQAGSVFVNTHGTESVNRKAPYGGVKQSGIGRRAGIEGIREYMQYQTLTTFET